MSEELEKRKAMMSIFKHDINNALTGVITSLGVLAMDDCFQDSEAGADLKEIRVAARRMKSMVEDMSIFFIDLPTETGISLEKLEATEFASRLKSDLQYLGATYAEEIPAAQQLYGRALLLVRGMFHLYQLMREFSLDPKTLALQIKPLADKVVLRWRTRSVNAPHLITVLQNPVACANNPKIAFALYYAEKVASYHHGTLSNVQYPEEVALEMQIPAN